MMSSKLWAPGKNRPCLARNSRTSGSRAADPLADQLVEVADHLAVRGEVLGRHRADRVATCPRRTGRAPAARAARRARRTARGRRAPGSRTRAGRGSAPRRRRAGRRAGRAAWPRRRASICAQVRVARRVRRADALGQPPLDARPLLGHDLVELAPDVAEDVAQPVSLEQLLAPALEAVHQVLQAGQVGARRVARPPAALHQPAQRLRQVALGHDVVGERVDDLVGIEVGDPWLPSQREYRARRARAARGRPSSAARLARAPVERPSRSRGSGEYGGHRPGRAHRW